MGPKGVNLDGLEVRRCFAAEMRADDTGEMRVRGYALKFNVVTMLGSRGWGWLESIAKEAMDTADLSDVVLDFNHEFGSLLARTSNGSLSLKADDTGLLAEARVADTAVGRDVYAMVKEGLVTKMSFMAVVKKSVWTFAEDGSEETDSRVITGFGRFYDVSAVTFPAYEDTEILAASRLGAGGTTPRFGPGGAGGLPFDTAAEAERRAREAQIYDRQLVRLNSILERVR